MVTVCRWATGPTLFWGWHERAVAVGGSSRSTLPPLNRGTMLLLTYLPARTMSAALLVLVFRGRT